ncbi:hypothetical protein VIGAN_03114500, partial [Vigna angularis var. angularis]
KQTVLKKQQSPHAHQNLELATSAKGMEICVFCFIYRWPYLLRSELLFQSFTWKLDLVEVTSLHCFRFFNLPFHLVCKDMGILQLSLFGSSHSILCFAYHFCILLFP